MSRIHISDHAAQRLAECHPASAGQADMAGVKKAMAASLARGYAAAQSLGVINWSIVIDGMMYVVRDGTVVTVVPKGSAGMRAYMLTDPRHAAR
jgi:hypothetical protein